MDSLVPVPTSREQLCALLAEAAEVEHHLMCSYLYAAFSLKTRPDEGLTSDELAAVDGWRREIVAVAVEEMAHLTMVCNILSSLGAPAHLVHRNFPILPGFHPAGLVICLAPFNLDTIAHFVFLERPSGMPIDDGDGYAPLARYTRQMNMDRLMTVCTDYETVGQLYRSITAGLQALAKKMGEERLFVGNPAHQLDATTGRLPGLCTVRCLKTALTCIEAIVRQGEGAETADETSHYTRFKRIQSEYKRLLASNPSFLPARNVADSPVMRPPPSPEGLVWVNEEPAACLLDLANALYNHCLRCLSLSYAGVNRDTQQLLVSAGVELMHWLTPVARRLTECRANRAHGNVTAGISFATIRSSAALLAEVASVDILTERLNEIAARCGYLASEHPQLNDLLSGTSRGVAGIATRLSTKMRTTSSVAEPQRTAAASGPLHPVVPMDAPHPVPPSAATHVETVPGLALDILYDGVRCIHARHCVLGLPRVFKANVPGQWIDPDQATTEELLTVAHMCPSGAIKYRRHDGGPEEQPPPVNLIQVRENGPLAVRASTLVDGEPVGMRVVLCRCGASKHKPYCDGSHNEVKFLATGEPPSIESAALAARSGVLRIDPEPNGPLVLTGNIEICAGTGRTINRLTSARLCRCGGSANKPYCDGSHRRIGFTS